MTKRSCYAALAFAFVAAMVIAPVAAGPCADFNDVEGTDTFCPNVEWLKNRATTLSCAEALCCPNAPATRLQMPAFLSRMGNFLPPTTVDTDKKAFAVYVQTPGDWFGYSGLLRQHGIVAHIDLFDLGANPGLHYGWGGTVDCELPNCPVAGNTWVEVNLSQAGYFFVERCGVVINGAPSPTLAPAWLHVTRPGWETGTVTYASAYSNGVCADTTGTKDLLRADRVVDLATIWTEPSTIQ